MNMDDKNVTRVTITLRDGSTNIKKLVDSFVYIPEGERLSDIMNDDRQFLPVYRLDNQYAHKGHIMVMVNKNAIALIEEQGNEKYGNGRH